MQRRTIQIGIVIFTALVSGAVSNLLAGARDDAKANEVIAGARKALGGEKKLTSLEALSLRAEFRRELTANVTRGGTSFVMIGGGGSIGGGSQVTGSIEMDVLFPDRYYRQETTTGGFSITRVEGFEGDRPFFDLISNSPGTRVASTGPASDPARANEALKRSRAELGRLMLGLVGGTQPSLPVTYTYVGQAESPDGKADVVDVNGPDDFKARLFLDTTTHLPLMLSYMEPEARPVRLMTQRPADGSPGTTTVTSHGGGVSTTSTSSGPTSSGGSRTPNSGHSQLTPEQRAEIEKQIKEAESTPPKLVEARIFFADYREIDGLMLPHRISRGSAEKTTEEWEIKSYKVNPNIKPDRFKVGTE